MYVIIWPLYIYTSNAIKDIQIQRPRATIVPAESGMAAAWLMLAWWLEGKAVEEAGAKLPALEPPLAPLLLPGV